ncbi:MAG: DUF305 domain-containing protein, partial [Bacteroidota bacterium]
KHHYLFSILALSGVFFACSSSQPALQTPTTDSVVEAQKTGSTITLSSEEKRDLEALYKARKDSARMRFTEADVNFMIGMIGHHAQALIMSDLAPKNGASLSVQTLASRIINAQNDEIATMQTWLRDREQQVPMVHVDGLMLMIHGVGDHHKHHMSHGNMPGMLSQEQLVELSEAQGVEFDRKFLTYMIEHHAGAVYMVEELFKTDGGGEGVETFKIASDIQVDQRTEIARMRLMLEQIADASN